MPESLLVAPRLGAPHVFETRTTSLAEEIGMPILRLRQVHGTGVEVIDDDTDIEPYLNPQSEDRPAADAVLSRRRGVAVAVLTADCVPILLHFPDVAAVGAVHSGWRGTAKDISGEALRAAARAFGADPRRCRAAIGPCVSAARYRVGMEVRQAFLDADLPPDLFRSPSVDESGHESWLCDLARAVGLQLVRAGVPRESVWSAARCTVSESHLFHSYRRDGAAAGRMASGIALP